MGIISVPSTFSSNTTISSSQVNSNFSTIYNEFNGSIAAANLATDAVTTAKIAADAVTSAKIADGAILPEALVAGAGTTWTWQSWTPTWTNLTVGNGTVTAFYNEVGKNIFATIAFTFGSTSSIAGSVAFSLPVTAAARYTGSAAGQYRIGGVYIEDLAVAGYTGYFRSASTTTSQIITEQASTTYVTAINVNATVPFTWATGDFLCGTLTYEAA